MFKKKFKEKYFLEIIVFLSGATLMIFEMIGSRLLGPYFGTSIFTWTAIIGVIMASLSYGYYKGGIIADKKASRENLSKILLLASFSILWTFLFKDTILFLTKYFIESVKVSSVVSATLLFAPASVFLGMISPYALKLKINDIENIAKIAGNLSAISTVGSILGTFIAGFFLIPFFGTAKILILLIIILISLSFLLIKKNIFLKISVLALMWVLLYGVDNFMKNKNILEFDTEYNKIWISKIRNNDKRDILIMGVNNENHSAMFIDNKTELVNEYTKYYHLVKYFNPDFKKSLMIGGAGYSFPKSFLKEYDVNKTIDVVEIDPKITKLAKKYFALDDKNKRLKIIHKGGRVFLNNTKNKYDVIFADAFSSHFSIPFQLTTREAVQRKYDILNDDGVVILNLISAFSGPKSEFLKSELKTYQETFPQVFLFKIRDDFEESKMQNIILVASKNKNIGKFNFNEMKNNNLKINQEIKGFLGKIYKKKIESGGIILTDDYAPVDYYINKNY